jgi:hypothetical protein
MFYFENVEVFKANQNKENWNKGKRGYTAFGVFMSNFLIISRLKFPESLG